MQLCLFGFEGTALSDSLRRQMDEGVAGFILFGRNIESTAQVAQLVFELKSYAKRPLILAVDQEGGRVARLRTPPMTHLPPMRMLGKPILPHLAQQAGALVGFELSALGIDWNLAPVLDVDTNPDNTAIGDRCFHGQAHQVAQLGLAFARGLESQGVASCAKHFPGQGDAQQDSHFFLPAIAHDEAFLRSRELLPFAAYAKAGLAAVMPAHVRYQALDMAWPSSLSPTLLRGLLRGEMGFEGLVVADDMGMGAIMLNWPMEKAAVQAIAAGSNLLLLCNSAQQRQQAVDALAKAIAEGSLPKEQLQLSCEKRKQFCEHFVQGASLRCSLLDSAEHRTLREAFWDNWNACPESQRLQPLDKDPTAP
ncbi:MAG: beta-N-acetylhexosaminidase [Proteobacteria bacterium]|nr:beta-N-acetylhexosaminidase [Cystobacterineae bacterium]MCL2259459.1 beta-N-acetylhexosaminidase [Cystobacterineae bacterium]MCL2314080.1 beta-N-acetylhexosaminidase [Pseudomonadota bacterium]